MVSQKISLVRESQMPRCMIPHRVHFRYGTKDLLKAFAQYVTHSCVNMQRMTGSPVVLATIE